MSLGFRLVLTLIPCPCRHYFWNSWLPGLFRLGSKPHCPFSSPGPWCSALIDSGWQAITTQQCGQQQRASLDWQTSEQGGGDAGVTLIPKFSQSHRQGWHTQHIGLHPALFKWYWHFIRKCPWLICIVGETQLCAMLSVNPCWEHTCEGI